MKRLIIGIVVCLLIASCIVILPITSTVANRLGETDGILTCSVTKKQSSQTTSPVIWDKETFAAFYSLAQTVNATFHGADPHMEYPLEETSYTLYLEHPQGESDLLVLTEGNLLFRSDCGTFNGYPLVPLLFCHDVLLWGHFHCGG